MKIFFNIFFEIYYVMDNRWTVLLLLNRQIKWNETRMLNDVKQWTIIIALLLLLKQHFASE